MRKIRTSTENRRNRFHIMINSFPTCNTSGNRFSISKDRMSFASIKTSPVIAFLIHLLVQGLTLYELNCSFQSFSFQYLLFQFIKMSFYFFRYKEIFLVTPTIHLFCRCCLFYSKRILPCALFVPATFGLP